MPVSDSSVDREIGMSQNQPINLIPPRLQASPRPRVASSMFIERNEFQPLGHQTLRELCLKSGYTGSWLIDRSANESSLGREPRKGNGMRKDIYSTIEPTGGIRISVDKGRVRRTLGPPWLRPGPSDHTFATTAMLPTT